MTEAQLAQERLETQLEITRILRRTKTLSDAQGDLLKTLAKSGHWDVAAMWFCDNPKARIGEFWHHEGSTDEKLPTLTSSLGKRLAASFWKLDLGKLKKIGELRLQELAQAVPKYSSWGIIPILQNGSHLTIIEFFGGRDDLLDQQLFETYQTFAYQLGQFVNQVDLKKRLKLAAAAKSKILDSIPDSIISVNGQGQVMEWNNASEVIFGYTTKEVLGREVWPLILPSDVPYIKKHQFKHEFLGKRIETIGLRRGEGFFDVEITVIRAQTKTSNTFNIFARDISARRRAEQNALKAEGRYRALVDGLPMTTYIVDADGIINYLSPQIEKLLGRSFERKEINALWELLLHPDDHERIPNDWQRWQKNGYLGQFAREYRLMCQDGSYKWVSDIALPIFDQDNELAYVQGCLMDISERKELEAERRKLFEDEWQARQFAEARQRQLSLLSRAGDILAQTLDYKETLGAVARLIVPSFADYCAFNLPDEGGTLRRVGAVYADENLAISERERQRVVLDRRVGKVIEGGRTEVFSGAFDNIFNDNIAAQIDLRPTLVIPLMAGPKAIGALTLVGAINRYYNDEDLMLLKEISRRAAMAIDNANLYKARSKVAKTLERSLLPPSLPKIPNLKIAARYHPAQTSTVGGDFYDLFPLGEEEWFVILGDVSGKGASAAALTAMVRYSLRAFASQEHGLEKLLESLNFAVNQYSSDVQFCTALCAKICPNGSNTEVHLANAGHPQPILIKEGILKVQQIDCRGVPLGMWPKIDVGVEHLTLHPGEKLLFHTDGVSEARRDGELFGEKRLGQFLEKHYDEDADTLVSRLEEEVLDFQSGRANDDIAIMVLEGTEIDSPAHSSLTEYGEELGGASKVNLRLDCDARSVAVARHALEAFSLYLSEDQLATAQLLTSEVVANAVKYSLADRDAYIGFSAELEIHNKLLHVKTNNQGFGFEAKASAVDLDAEAGRGLFLVEQLATRWGTSTDERTEVWFDISFKDLFSSHPPPNMAKESTEDKDDGLTD